MRRVQRDNVAAYVALVTALGAWNCQTAGPAPPPGQPGAPPPASDPAEARRPVRQAPEEVVVAAWAEPPHLPPGGGQVHILVRAQKRDGRPFAGVEVRLEASTGSLYSGGRILVTDARGMTRDRLTARHAAAVVLNVGGTRYKFHVPVEGVTSGR